MRAAIALIPTTTPVSNATPVATATVVPTPTPRPTATPVPTPTPMPRPTATLVPTPTPPPSVAQVVKEVKPGVVQIFTSTGNGDDWWVYDVQEYSRNKERLREALVSETSILFEESSKVARNLEIIRRNSNWGETTLQ